MTNHPNRKRKFAIVQNERVVQEFDCKHDMFVFIEMHYAGERSVNNLSDAEHEVSGCGDRRIISGRNNYKAFL